MARSSNFLKSKTRSTFLTSLVTIALVLFFLNLFAAGAIYSHLLFEYTQENFEVMVELPDHVSDQKQQAFGAWLENQSFVKEIHFISKDEAGKIFSEANGKEFMEIMDGLNPLPASYNFKLKIDWINTDSVAKIQKLIEGQSILNVRDVTYPIAEIDQLRENTFGFIKIGALIGALVTLIAFFIVNSTIRLAIYGKRLMIRSMQLIGATNSFIRWPFVRMGMLQGFLGALLANLLLLGLVFSLRYFNFGAGATEMAGLELKDLLIRPEFLFLSGGIVIFGTFLGWLSSSWAVSRFLNKNLDQLM
jgi:cell division transport system permease protein